jgi:hypothetical protein
MVHYDGLLLLSSGMISHGRSQLTIILSPDCNKEAETDACIPHMGGADEERLLVH